MLLLGRNLGESIVINDNIVIKFMKGSGDDIKVAIDAPRSVKIVRGEVFEKEAKLAFLNSD